MNGSEFRPNSKPGSTLQSPSTKTLDFDGRPFLIGVTGGSASGKTTVCEKIMEGLEDHRCVMVCLDWYYRGIPEGCDPDTYNFDHPDALDFDALYETLLQMLERKSVTVPCYDFATHKRSGTKRIEAAEIIVVEGILTFYNPQVRNLLNMKIFVDEDSDVCLCRRIRRDVSIRGRSVESVLNQYEQFVKPAYEEFIQPCKRYADIIVPRGGENLIAIDLIVKHIGLRLHHETFYLQLENSQMNSAWMGRMNNPQS